jgi:hypothetical protein
MMLAIAIVAIVVGWGAVLVLRAGPAPAPGWAPSEPARTQPVVPVAPSPVAPQVSVGHPLPVFATAGGVRVRVVSGDTVAVAFHEASYDDALALRPTGVCGRCKNPWKFRPPPPRDPTLRYLVTHSRGRDTPATSAADLVLPKGTPVFAPVDGVVSRVRRYRLYRRYPDVRVELIPHSAPGLLVVMLHVGAVQVRRGEEVVASTTVIGAARRLPFESQVDRYVRGRYPHVHLEVKDAAAARRASP